MIRGSLESGRPNRIRTDRPAKREASPALGCWPRACSTRLVRRAGINEANASVRFYEAPTEGARRAQPPDKRPFEYDPAAWGEQLERYVDVVENHALVEDRNIFTSLLN